MTRKDYLLIAEAIQSARYTAKVSGHDDKSLNIVAFEFARLLASDNDNFDRERFLAACSGESVGS